MENQSRQTNTELPDGHGAWTYDNGSDSCKINSNEQIRSSDTSPEFEHSVDPAFKTATPLLQYDCLGNSSILLPVHLQIAEGVSPQVGETGLYPFIVPAASSTISMPLVLKQQVFQHLNTQLPPSLHSCPFANIQTNISSKNSLSQPQLATLGPEALVHSKDALICQRSGITTALQDLIPLLSNYVSSVYQMTGPDQPVPSAPNVQPQSMDSLVTSLLPPTTLLVPYPFVMPLPVPLPIPILIPQSPVYTKTSRTVSMKNRSTQTLTTDFPTISCYAKNIYYPILPHTPQDEVLDLSIKTTQTQTRQEHLLSASANSALDLSAAVKCLQWLPPNKIKDQAAHRQSTQYKWTKDEGNRNDITGLKFEANNGRIVSSSQTVKVIVSATQTVPANLRCFPSVHMINSGMEPDNSRVTVPELSYGLPSKTHTLHSEPYRHVLKNRPLHFKRGRSQNIFEETAPYKKHLASFLPGK